MTSKLRTALDFIHTTPDHAQRVMIECDQSALITSSGHLRLSLLSELIEEVAELHNKGVLCVVMLRVIDEHLSKLQTLISAFFDALDVSFSYLTTSAEHLNGVHLEAHSLLEVSPQALVIGVRMPPSEQVAQRPLSAELVQTLQLGGHIYVSCCDDLLSMERLHNPPPEPAQPSDVVNIRADVARTCVAKQALLTLSSEERSDILEAIADALEARSDEILDANRRDLELAHEQEVAPPLIKRLALSRDKLKTLVHGIREIARVPEPIGRRINAMELSQELTLEQISAPIGVLLVIFESRPDSLPQIAALSLRAGNGLILKGGREARYSNQCLHTVITETIERVTDGRVSRDVIGLVTTRAEIKHLLELDDLIDLVVPRGGNALVQHVQDNTKIPVLGHADGVCHVYVDERADLSKAVRVVVDAKVNYPAACNAMETLLIHRALFDNGAATTLIDALEREGVRVLRGPKACSEGLVSHLESIASSELDGVDPLHVEYGDLVCACEVVDHLDEAIAHCNQHGSGHTEAIISEESDHIERFLHEVDSACVFANASTRFADGFRFGLGAEVGISTSRIHARGPVGIEGLLTSKWLLRSTAQSGHAVGDFAQKGGPSYTHRPIEEEV